MLPALPVVMTNLRYIIRDTLFFTGTCFGFNDIGKCGLSTFDLTR